MQGGAPTAGTGPMPPPPLYPWYPPPRPDHSRTAIIIVVVVVVVIVVTLVLAAVLYVMVAGLLVGHGSPVPSVRLGAAAPCGGGCWTVEVDAVSAQTPLSSWSVLIERLPDTTVEPLRAGVLYSLGNFTVSFDDGGDGILRLGDVFRVEDPAAGQEYALSLLWAQTGEVVSTVRWSG